MKATLGPGPAPPAGALPKPAAACRSHAGLEKPEDFGVGKQQPQHE